MRAPAPDASRSGPPRAAAAPPSSVAATTPDVHASPSAPTVAPVAEQRQSASLPVSQPVGRSDAPSAAASVASQSRPAANGAPGLASPGAAKPSDTPMPADEPMLSAPSRDDDERLRGDDGSPPQRSAPVAPPSRIPLPPSRPAIAPAAATTDAAAVSAAMRRAISARAVRSAEPPAAAAPGRAPPPPPPPPPRISPAFLSPLLRAVPAALNPQPIETGRTQAGVGAVIAPSVQRRFWLDSVTGAEEPPPSAPTLTAAAPGPSLAPLAPTVQTSAPATPADAEPVRIEIGTIELNAAPAAIRQRSPHPSLADYLRSRPRRRP